MTKNLLFFDGCFDKNRLKFLISWSLVHCGEHITINLVENLKNIGYTYATEAGVSLGIDDLKIPLTKANFILDAEKEIYNTQIQYKHEYVTGVEKFQQLIDTWHRTSERLKHTVIQYFKITDILNPVYMMAFSGARGNISQVRQLIGMRGLMSDPQGQILDFPIKSNFREGLTLTEYIISCYGARKGLVDTALKTANSGYLTRRLVDVSHHIIVCDFDCKTTRGILLTDTLENKKVIIPLQIRLVGRILADDIYHTTDSIKKKKKWSDDFENRNHQISSLHHKKKIVTSIENLKQPGTVKSDTFYFYLLKMYFIEICVYAVFLQPTLIAQNKNTIDFYTLFLFLKCVSFKRNLIAGKNTEISPQLAAKIASLKKKVLVRSPLTCEIKNSICQLCYGWSLAYGKLVSLGEAVGVIAAQSIGEPGTQLTMRTFHTGGVFSGDIMSEITAPCDGIINYPRFFQGMLIRTPHGKIAFLTKVSGRFEISPLVNKVSTGKQIQQTTLAFQIPALTILFIRNHQRVTKTQVIAEFSAISNNRNQRILSRYDVKTEIEGEVLFDENANIRVTVKKSKKDKTQIKLMSRTTMNMSSVWVLSSKIYKQRMPVNILPQPGDIVNDYSIFGQYETMALHNGFLTFPIKKSEIVLDTKSQLFFPTNYESPFFQNTKKKDSNFFCKKCNSENTKSKLSTKIMLQLPLKKCTNLETKLSTTHLSTSKTFLNKTLILFSVHSIQYKKIGYFFLFSFFKNTKLYHDRFFLSNSLQDRFQNPTKLQTNLYFQSFPKKYQTQTGGIRIFDPFYIHKKMYSGEIFWIPQEFYFFISKNTVFLNTVLNKTQPANPINSNTVFSPINQIFFLQHEINEKKKYTTWSTCSTPLIFQTTSQGFLKPFYSTLSGYVQMNTIHPYKKTRKIKWILFKSTRKPNQHVKLQCKKIKTDVQKKKKVATVKNQELTSTVYQKNTYSKHTNKFIASKNFKFPNLFKNTTVELSSFSNFFKTSKVKTSTQNCIRLYTVDYQFSTFFILGLKKNLWFCFSKFKQNKKIQLTTIQNNYLPLLQSQFCFQQNFSSFPIRSCFKQTKNRIKLKIQSGWIYFPTHAKQALSQHKCISKPGKECFDSVFFDQYPVFLEYLVVKNISVQNKKSIFKKTQNLKKILHISHIYSKFFIDGSEKTKSKYSFNSDWEISLNKTFFYIYTILLFHTNCSVTQILYSKKIRSIHVKSFYKNLSVEKYLQENNTITHKLNKYRKLYFLQNRIQISIRNKLIVSDYLSVINTISHNQIFQFALLSSPIPYEAIQIKNFKIPKNKKNFGKNMFLPKFLILVRKITSYSITNSLQYKKLFAQATQSNLNLVANSTTFTKQSATYLFPTLANTDFFVKPDLKKKESQIHYFIKNITILEFSILFKLFHKSLLTQSKINLNVKSNASLIQQTKNKVLNRFTKLCKQQNKIHTPKTIYFEMAVFQQVEFSYLLPFTSLNTKFLTSSTTAFSSKQRQTKHPFEQKANKIVQTQILLSSSNSISNKQPASITNFFSPYQGEILEPIKQPPLVNPSLKFLERKNILKKLLDRDTMKKNTYLVLTDEDQISFSTDSTSFLKNTLDSTFPITSFLGKLVEYGTKIKTDLALSQSGHIVQIEKSKITLRNAQSILFSKNGFLTAQHGDLIEKNALVLSLFYQRLQTGDIVQGIPKIEQLFEARQTFQGEILVGSLHTQLQYQFYIYQTYTTLEKAARRSIENIQQKIVRNVQQVYLAQGVRIAEKHLEIIVRQMTLKVEIIRGKETLLIPGEIVDLEWIEKVNRVIKEKKNKVTYKPLIRGITQKSLDTTSFISEASFQETTRVLTRSAIQGKIDFLRGLKENVILGHLIPAGTGFMGKIIDPRKSKYISPILEPHYLSLMSYTNFRNIFSKKKVNHTHTE